MPKCSRCFHVRVSCFLGATKTGQRRMEKKEKRLHPNWELGSVHAVDTVDGSEILY